MAATLYLIPDLVWPRFVLIRIDARGPMAGQRTEKHESANNGLGLVFAHRIRVLGCVYGLSGQGDG